jgi:predicted dehydrogenase
MSFVPGKKIGMGLVGPGFIASHHIDAVRRLGFAEVVALADINADQARSKADALGIPNAYGSAAELIADPSVDVIHNTTPNHLHFSVSMAAIEAGKHIVSEKPLAMDADQCRRLRDAASAAGVVNAVMFNYRGNPLVQQMRSMIAADEIGTPVFVKGQYLQDWLTDDHVFSWRLDPALGGKSSALADIGSHTCDLAEHVLGSKVTEVLADLGTIVKKRYTSGSAIAFSGEKGGDLREVDIAGEDVANVFVRFANGAKGIVTVGQVLPGHKNDLQLEINGRKASLGWKQESQNELWIGRYDAPNSVMAKDPSLMSAAAKPYAHLPGGHQEGWPDAFFNVVKAIYGWVQAGAASPKPDVVSSFADATHVTEIVDAMLRSHEGGNVWTSVE